MSWKLFSMLLAIRSTNSYNLCMLLILLFTFFSRETTLEILCYSRHTVWSNAELELALTPFDTQLPVDCVGSQEYNSDHPLRKTEHLFYFAPAQAKFSYFFTESTGDLKVDVYLKNFAYEAGLWTIISAHVFTKHTHRRLFWWTCQKWK